MPKTHLDMKSTNFHATHTAEYRSTVVLQDIQFAKHLAINQKKLLSKLHLGEEKIVLSVFSTAYFKTTPSAKASAGDNFFSTVCHIQAFHRLGIMPLVQQDVCLTSGANPNIAVHHSDIYC